MKQGVFSLRSFLMSTWTILSHSSIHNISAVALVTVFLNQGGDTLTGTDIHQPLKWATFGRKNPETNSGYATEHSMNYTSIHVRLHRSIHIESFTDILDVCNYRVHEAR